MSDWLEKVSLGGGKAEEAKTAKVERNKRNKAALEEAMKYLTGVKNKPAGYDTEVNTDKKYNSGVGFGGPDTPKKKPKND